jgi:shikimate kinase
VTDLARPIIITGFMGAGKTTVAAALAGKLACSMIDLDTFIQEREGRTAQVIIDDAGEDSFRKLESQALRDALAAGYTGILALGGGTWTISGNRALIKELNALTVWLDAPFDLCWERISSGNNERPLARNREDARRLYEQRLELYELASIHVQVMRGKSMDDIVTEILAAYREASNRSTSWS